MIHKEIGIVDGVNVDETVETILESMLDISSLIDGGFELDNITTNELYNLSLCLKGANEILKRRATKNED